MNDVTNVFWARLAWVQGWPEAHHSQKHQRPSCGMTDMLMESSETESREDPLSQYLPPPAVIAHVSACEVHTWIVKYIKVASFQTFCTNVVPYRKWWKASHGPGSEAMLYVQVFILHAMCKLTTQNTANILNSNPRINFTQGFTTVIQWPGMPLDLSPHRLTPAMQWYIPRSSPCRSAYARRHPGILNFPTQAIPHLCNETSHTPAPHTRSTIRQKEVPQTSTHRLYYAIGRSTILHTQAENYEILQLNTCTYTSCNFCNSYGHTNSTALTLPESHVSAYVRYIYRTCT